MTDPHPGSRRSPPDFDGDPCYDIGYNIGRRPPDGQGVGERREEEGRTGTRRPGPARRARTSGTPKSSRVYGFTGVHKFTGFTGVHGPAGRGSGVHPPKNPPFLSVFPVPHDDFDPREGKDIPPTPQIGLKPAFVPANRAEIHARWGEPSFHAGETGITLTFPPRFGFGVPFENRMGSRRSSQNTDTS